MPADAEFCLITFTLLPSPFLNATSLAQRNAAKWTYEPRASGATTFVAPRLARSNSWYNVPGSAPLDVTENIYIGARPGHNRQVCRSGTTHTQTTHTLYTSTCTTVHMSICAHLICKQLITDLCDGTGQDGAFRPAGHRIQPGILLQREHGLVRALRRLSNVSSFLFVCCVHACGLSVARATLPDFERRSSISYLDHMR